MRYWIHLLSGKLFLYFFLVLAEEADAVDHRLYLWHVWLLEFILNAVRCPA